MKTRGTRVAQLQVALVAWVTCGCGADFGDPPGASGGQVTWTLGARPMAPETILAVVDDTSAGVALREQLALAFDHLDADLASHLESCTPPFDPAAWHPIDRSIVIIHPSTAGVAGYSSPADDPALRWRDNQPAEDGRVRWMTAVRAALAAHPAEPGAAFQALAALNDSESLLGGSRPPATPEEQTLLAALPPEGFGELGYGAVVVALATEDQSPGAASQYRSDDSAWVVPAATPDPTAACADRSEATTPRYAGWADAQRWPCENPQFFDFLFEDCRSNCLPRPIAIADGGSAQCRATATYSGSDPCPTELGWLDPMGPSGVRVPRVDHDASGDTRVCEVRQLEGAALASCRSTLDCADCAPGWCATQVPELTAQERCALGNYYPPFRFVLGAGQAHRGEISIVCDEPLQ